MPEIGPYHDPSPAAKAVMALNAAGLKLSYIIPSHRRNPEAIYASGFSFMTA
jgi:hypothetical protein